VALRNDGTVWVWGQNLASEIYIGSPSPNDLKSPQQVPGLAGVTAIAAGDLHVLALCNDGSVRIWGNNEYGQLGLGHKFVQATPVALPGLDGAQKVFAGGLNNVVIAAAGNARAWGDNGDGQLGDGTKQARLSPASAPAFASAQHVALGFTHTQITRTDGVWSMGWNKWGQLGDGTTTESMQPVPLSLVVAP
jgi:alpha-tubulin suppressor-like RCC1 family protein